MRIIRYVFGFLGIMSLGFTACDENVIHDNQTSGSIKVSIDDSYQPIMEEQLRIFKSRFPNSNIKAEFKPEAACIKDYLEDTTRVIFVTRDLTKEEKEYALSKQMVTRSLPMARDAIVFITSKSNTNPEFTVNEIKQILTGQFSKKDYQVVFDHAESSTVRYITDSVLKGQKMSTNVFAAKSSEEVINYVSTNDNAIGVIGVSWIADHKDSTVDTFLKQINIAGIRSDTSSSQSYIKPYQAYIGLREYPFTREFYFISKETWPGLGTGLVNYLCRDGQLVFKQAKLFPLRVNVMLREATGK